MLYRDEIPNDVPDSPHEQTRALGLGVYDAEVYDFGEVRAYIACRHCESGQSIFEADGHLWARAIHAVDCPAARDAETGAR